MRRATNNKWGQWVEVSFKGPNNKRFPGYIAYAMTQRGSRFHVAFTKEGEHFNPDYTWRVAKETPIEPPRWAVNLWNVWDEADFVNHYAMLYNARYKTIIEQSTEERGSVELRERKAVIKFLEKLADKEPWK